MYYKLEFSSCNLYCHKHWTKSIFYIYNKFCYINLYYKPLEFKHVLARELFLQTFSS